MASGSGDLTGKVALVTGGSRGIGAAISIGLKNAGYSVAANYAGNDEAAAKFTAETGIKTYKWSVADYEACAAGIAKVEAAGLGIRVFSAGDFRVPGTHRSARVGRAHEQDIVGVLRMTQAKSQFVGAAGQYFVAYRLASEKIHASLTLGNAPAVDLLAASSDGSSALAIQVKTASDAYRAKRYGHEGYEWAVGSKVNPSEKLVFAFVDFQGGRATPRVFIVPSAWVALFAETGGGRYFLPKAVEDLTLEQWDRIKGCLAGDPAAAEWANIVPTDRLVQWDA